MADFDAIVVGSGCAGPAAAYELAKAGKSVLVIERGTTSGAKNVSGGRLYLHALRALFPDDAGSAPLERRIVRERVSLLSADSATTLDVTDELMRDERYESWSVLRARFDPWLAEQAEGAGAEYINGIAVEELLKDGDRVTGVRAGDDEITADVVLLCDGVNSLLVPQAVGAPRPRPDQVAVGVKHVVELPETVISDRAMCADGDGMAWLFVGDATHGRVGGGFLYTNRDTISVGIVATVSDLMESETPIYQLLEEFTRHPAVAPILEGGTVVEHSGHLVAEGGYDALPPLVGDGVLLAGESALMCVNAGYTVRGMDLALAAGQQAGRSAAAALDAGDTSAEGLAGYRAALEDSFVLRDLRTLRRFPHFMESTPRVFRDYPDLARDVMRELFLVDGTPMRPLAKAVPPIVKRTGYLNVAKDLVKGMRSL
ncbi:FAD-dependent oxidoreductase [Actinotalea sp. M2MS4P-6]|uniref:FAD-dependent oxidoreductase n=1 Tax=Actinotalea sp. M2MS4P-6 TaxID=2983762 RepID=UPI0021E4F508|nr:FAD-dependent oxidoreductase [Actinotalea sp. M2MS4P-6]MCV2394458.1 FAD-dependent oxidoreductase [Actinotalea sp. M2MS4P-6]